MHTVVCALHLIRPYMTRRDLIFEQSLLSALDALTATRVALLFFFVTVRGLSATSRFSVSHALVEWLQLDRLRIHLNIRLASRAWQRGFEAIYASSRDGVRECHCELDKQVAKLKRLLMEGKTLVRYRLQIVRLYHFTRLVPDTDFSAIKVSQHEVDTC